MRMGGGSLIGRLLPRNCNGNVGCMSGYWTKRSASAAGFTRQTARPAIRTIARSLTGNLYQRRLCQVLFLVFSVPFFIFFCFFGHTTPFTPKSVLLCSVKPHFDDHGSFVIFRSVSVRPIHIFDLYLDHDLSRVSIPAASGSDSVA